MSESIGCLHRQKLLIPGFNLDPNQRKNMKTVKLFFTLLMLLAIGTLVGCSGASKSPDVSDSIRKSLDEAGLKNVSVTQDRDKGVVTLGGSVKTDADKAQAESIANSIAT